MSIKSIRTGYKGISALAGNPVLGDFESIATTTLSATTASVTFSSIPSTFQHLQIRTTALSDTSGGSLRIRFNSDSTSSYSQHQVYGDGSGPGSTGAASQTSIIAALTNGTTANPTVDVTDILDYNNSSKNTTIRSLGGYDANGSGYVMLRSGAWFKTDAVTSVEVGLTTGSFRANTTIALYGIRG